MSTVVVGDFAYVDWDTKEFSEALHLYAELSKKSFDEALKKKGADVFFRASKLAPRAAVARIRAKYTPRFIAAALRKTKGGNKELVSGRHVSKRGKVYWPHYFRQWSAEEARKMYLALRKRAGRSVGFTRAFLAAMAKSIRGIGGGVGGAYDIYANGGKGQGVETKIKFFMTDKGEEMLIDGLYSYRRRRRSPSIEDQILEDAVYKGMDEVKADMAQYIERKLSEAGVRVSA